MDNIQQLETFKKKITRKAHTVGPANKEVPESTIAEHPSAQQPEKHEDTGE